MTADQLWRVEIADTSEAAVAQLWIAGAQGVRLQDDRVSAWFDHQPDIADALVVVEEPQVDWHARWQESVDPVTAGGFTIGAEFHGLTPDASTIVLTPGQAFGTGHHPTTSMCLQWLRELVTPGDTVTDVGCGSAILSVAAAHLGAESVEAFDIDPIAIDVAHQVVANNGVADRVQLRTAALDGTLATALPRAEVVVANMLSHLLIDLAGAIRQLVADGGAVIVSGIDESNGDRVRTALEQAGLTHHTTRQDGEWLSMHLTAQPEQDIS